MEAFAARKAQLKGGVSAADARRRRAQNSIKISKNKRMEGLMKRRGGVSSASTAQSNADVIKEAGSLPKDLRVENLQLYFNAVTSQDANLQFEGVHYIRRLLSKEDDPPTEAVLATGVLPYLVSFLDSSNSRMQFESCWAITNIASTVHTKKVVDAGAVPKLVGLLTSGDVDVREQSIWCLGNVAGDGANHRDVVLAVPNAVQNIILNVQNPGSVSLLRNATWALSNLCRGKPRTPLQVAKAIAPVLISLVCTKNVDKDALQDALWGLSYISDCGDSHIGCVVSTNGIAAMVGHMSNADTHIIIPALRTAGNIVTGTDEQTQAVLDGGFIPQLARLVCHDRRNVRREACWAASNIAAGTPAQINTLVSFPGVVAGLVKQLDGGEWHVRKEAAWALSNIATAGVAHHIDILVAAGMLGPLAAILVVDDARVVQVSLEAVEAILKQGKQYSDAGRAEDFVGSFEEAGGVDALDDLQRHANEQIHTRATHLIEAYVGTEDEDEEEAENTQPAISNTGTFQFGAPSKAFNGQNNAMVPAGMHAAAPPAVGPATAAPTGGLLGGQFNFSNVTFA